MRHVLVIEDDLLIQRCIADMALFGGASSVEMVESEDAAIAAAALRRPSIIISDVDLKKGGRGPVAVSAIRSVHGSIPVIFVTGQPNDPGAKAQASAILRKPCTAVQLIRTLETVSSELHHWRDVHQFRSVVPQNRGEQAKASDAQASCATSPN